MSESVDDMLFGSNVCTNLPCSCFESLPRVCRALDVPIVVLDCAHSPSLCSAQRVQRLPGMQLFKADGVQVYHGKMRPREVVAWIEVSVGLCASLYPRPRFDWLIDGSAKPCC